jgi:cell division protein FtsQ
VTSLDGALYLVGRSGDPFKRLEPGDPFDLPVITGPAARDWGRDRQGTEERLAEGLDLLRRYRALPISKRHEPQELNLAPGGEAVLTVGTTPVALHLGAAPWQKQLLRAVRVLERVRAGREPSVVFADNRAHPERVVVRMR